MTLYLKYGFSKDDIAHPFFFSFLSGELFMLVPVHGI